MMFASPEVRVYSEENTSAVMKKPGLITTSSKKPFNDRAVNASPVRRTEVLKNPEQIRLPSPKKSAEDSLFIYDTYSFRTFEDNYTDINNLLGKKVFNILKSYCRYDCQTPPPELGSLDEEYFSENESILEDSTSFLDLSVDDVPLPRFDF